MNLRTQSHSNLLNIIEDLISDDKSNQASEYLSKLKKNIFAW